MRSIYFISDFLCAIVLFVVGACFLFAILPSSPLNKLTTDSSFSYMFGERYLSFSGFFGVYGDDLLGVVEIVDNRMEDVVVFFI